MRTYNLNTSGFSLVEMAIVLVIVGLLLGGGLAIFTTQQELRRTDETMTLLNEARDALIGYAIVNQRLPCPASAISNGVESPPGGGICSNPFNGFLPAVTLGLSGVDANGYLPDAWQSSQNRIRYAVTTANLGAFDFTTTNGMHNTGMATLASDLRVCASSTGISATQCSTPETTNVLTNNAVAVIYSLGHNAPTGGTGADETANPNPNSANNDRVFVSHSPVGTGGAGGEFDDLVIWLSPNILFNRMVIAGVLP